MATVVTIMDRSGFDQRTDNIVIADPRHRRLLWVPRDVWCPEVGDRINTAYRSGGHDGLLRGLRSLGFRVDHSVCIPRAATERFLGTVTVDVPIERPLRFWYPLSPQSRIEDGRREVDFDPPGEILSGERIHQWIGARTSRDAGERGSDLDRIQRQQVLVRALLRQGSELSAVVGGPELPSWSDETAARRDLRHVRWWWAMRGADQVRDRLIDGRQVLELLSPEPTPARWRRALHRVGRRRPGH